MPELPAGLTAGGRFASWAPDDIAYLAIDVDGTLVGRHDEVRDDTAAALLRALEAGLAVGYATGRMHGALTAIDDVIALPGPHVVHNGAQVRMGGAVVEQWPLQDDEVDALLDIAAQLDAYGELYLPDGFIITKDDPRAHVHWDLLGTPPLGDLVALNGYAVLKATFIGFSDAESDRIVSAILAAGLEAGPAESLLTPGLTYVNATRPGVDKGHAITAAAKAAVTTLAGTCVIGDGANDVPMLTVAGTAVAMGQASQAVKDAAHLVTTHVDDGGLALAINALLTSAA